ncbi:metalloendoproteinase 1-like [Neltuma alba]|uniref:metalloendoproteinase 1-like n=1 Tax=Neltuma alba TaxID=207710 RepID=UPI0010A2C9D4|nr:metalloendoproteinase 1-like [Prosopis alba]
MVVAAITQTLILRLLLVFFLSVNFQTMVQPQSLASEDLAIAKNYLEAFGYLAQNNGSNPLEDHMEAATRKFRELYNLNVSGKLDDETMKAMSKCRCGVPDTYRGQPRTWPPNKRHLTYSINSSQVETMSLDILRPVFRLAFVQWSQVTSFTFAEAAFGTASDIVIGVYCSDHGDSFPFDGPGNVLAHAFPPTDGRLHYDGDEQWSSLVPPQPDDAFDLVWVAIHEIGHLLGLAHSNDPSAIMFAEVDSGKNKRTLGADDIAAIKALYPHA